MQALRALGIGLGLLGLIAPSGSSARGAAPVPIGLDSIRNDLSPFDLRALRETQPAGTPNVGRTGGGALIGPIQSFEGIANEENDGGAADGPPDAEGDVGPHHYVQWVNSALAVYDKAGKRLLGPLPGNLLWKDFGGVCETANKGDPIVLYDQLADRWVLTQFASPIRANYPQPPHLQCLAVSQTSDPTGHYYRYAFRMPDDLVNDYAKLAVWPDGYYMSDNRTKANGQSVGAGAVAFERSAMLAGRPARGVFVPLGPELSGLLPTDLEGGREPPPGTPETFVRIDAAADELELWRFSADFAAPASSRFVSQIDLPATPFDSSLCDHRRNCIEQPGTTQTLDGLSDRLLFRATYRRFPTSSAIVAVHTVDVGQDHAGIRWYEVRQAQGAPQIRDQGTYAPDEQDRWLGSAAIDGAGDLGLGFSLAGPATFPSIGFSGRRGGNPPPPMPGAEGEGRLATGGGSQSASNRWGDYSSMSVDPVDDCTFWYTQEYYPASSGIGWHTRVGSFKFPGCGPTPVVAGQPREGGTLVAQPGDWTKLPGATFTYQWRRCDAKGDTCSDLAGATGNAHPVTGTDVDSTLRVVVTGSSAAGVASALSAPTPLVSPVPAGGPLDLTLRVTPTQVEARRGSVMSFVLTVGNASASGSATGVILTDVLPVGAELISAVSDRGPGCEGTTTVVCPLTFLPGGRTATVALRVRLDVRGRLSNAGSVRGDQTELVPSTNAADALVVVRGPPRLGFVGVSPLTARVTAKRLDVAARVSFDEPVRLRARVLDDHGRPLPLLAGSVLGGGRSVRHRTEVVSEQPAAGTASLLLRVPLDRVRARRIYRVAVDAVDADAERRLVAESFGRP